MNVAITDIKASLGLKDKIDSGSRVRLALAAGFLLAAAVVSPMAQSTTGVMIESWTGIAGGSVSSLVANAKFADFPSTRTYGGAFEIPMDQGTLHGTRVRAYITPPVTGSYTFWISGDDNCELWLGTG